MAAEKTWQELYDDKGGVLVVQSDDDERRVLAGVATNLLKHGVGDRWTAKPLADFAVSPFMILQNLGKYTFNETFEFMARVRSEQPNAVVFAILDLRDEPVDDGEDVYYAKRYEHAMSLPAYRISGPDLVQVAAPDDEGDDDEDDEDDGLGPDLAFINAHRRKLGMRPLDPWSTGWTSDDVRQEAERIRQLDPAAAVGDSGAKKAGSFDAAAYTTTKCFRPVDWGRFGRSRDG
jgi:hypothetical protein